MIFNLTLILTYSLLKLVFIPEVSFCPELLFISEVTFTRWSNFFVSEVAFYLWNFIDIWSDFWSLKSHLMFKVAFDLYFYLHLTLFFSKVSFISRVTFLSEVTFHLWTYFHSLKVFFISEIHAFFLYKTLFYVTSLVIFEVKFCVLSHFSSPLMLLSSGFMFFWSSF